MTNYQELYANLTGAIEGLIAETNNRWILSPGVGRDETDAEVFADFWAEILRALLVHADGNPAEIAAFLCDTAHDEGIDIAPDERARFAVPVLGTVEDGRVVWTS